MDTPTHYSCGYQTICKWISYKVVRTTEFHPIKSEIYYYIKKFLSSLTNMKSYETYHMISIIIHEHPLLIHQISLKKIWLIQLRR